MRPAPSSVCCVLYTSGSTARAIGVRHPDAPGGPHGGGGRRSVADSRDVSRRTGRVTLGLVAAPHDGRHHRRHGPLERTRCRRAHRGAPSDGAGTPFFLSTLDEADASDCDISSLSRFLVGAATVLPALVSRAGDRGIISWRTYGSTEHPAISSGGPDDPPDKRRSTDSRVGPGNEVRLVDEHGCDVSPGEEGEIVARGPRQFLGYQNDDLGDEAFLDESWFRTGDLARFDADGYLVLTDRLKDVIFRGENISAREVEDALVTHPAVHKMAVCAVPNERWGEGVCAFIAPREGHSPWLDELGAPRPRSRIGHA
ncbi:MAG: AMP-binding protein [Nitriliruptorales bacterium]